MKRLAMFLAALCALAMVTGHLLAQEGADKPKTKDKKVKKQGEPKKKKPRMRAAHAQMVKVCGLSEDQQKKISDLMAERGKALKAFQEENKDKYKALSEAAKKARESKDKEAARKAWKDMGALNAQRNEIMKKSQAAVLAVLTDEQRAKWDEYNVLRSVQGRFRGVKLTEEQMAKIKAEYVKAAAGADMSDQKARQKVIRDLAVKVGDEILTDDQKATVAAHRVLRRFYRVKPKLSDEQFAKVKAACAKALAGVDKTKRGAAEKAMRDVAKQVREEILTDAQRESLPKPKARPDRKPKDKAKPKATATDAAE